MVADIESVIEPMPAVGGSLPGAAFASLDGAGVRWAVLRDDPMAADTADIDLLVHRDDVSRLDAALAPAGFARLITWRHGDHRFFIAYDDGVDRWVKLDIVTELAYRTGRRLPEPAIDAALANRARVGPVSRLDANDEFWALLLHCLFDRESVAPRHLERLRLLAGRDPGGPLRDALGRPRAAEAAVALALVGDVAGLIDLRDSLGARLSRHPTRQRLWRAGLSAAAPLLKAVRRPGLSIAVLGPDGAGKSTLVQSLPGTLPLPVRTYYAGLYGERLRVGRSTRIPGVAMASQLAIAWASYLSAAFQRRCGRFTVFDRYGYDALLPAADGRVDSKRRIRRFLLGRLVPRPDLVLVLDAPAAQLHGRKGEHGLAVAEWRRTGYRLLAQQLDGRVTTELLDTSADRSVVRRRATLLIWRTFARRRTPAGRVLSAEIHSTGDATEKVDAHGNR